jgi:hypothetical protein
MNERISRPSRRSVLGGLTAAALYAGDAAGQERIANSEIKASLSPERLKTRTESFVVTFDTPEPIDGLAPTRVTSLFACVLVRTAEGAPLRSYKKEIAYSKDIRGSFTTRPVDFLDPKEQIIALSLHSEGDYSISGGYKAEAHFTLSITDEPPIPHGFACDTKIS